ncbi:MAG: hypothetical protein ACYSTF_05815 [Planctomycetota bacterium]
MNEKRQLQEDSSRENERRQTLVMVMFLTAGLFITVIIMSVVVVLAVKESRTPREAILRHPDKAMVAVGLAKKDLDQAEKLLKEHAKSLVRGALRGALRGDMNGEMGEVRQSLYPIHELFASGRIIIIPNGTKCLILKSHRSKCKVRITEGSRKELVCWTYAKCVVR